MADELTPGQRRYRAQQERLREQGREEERLRSREESVSRREGALNRTSSPSRSGSRPDPSLAVVALTVAGGVIFYDLARGSSGSGQKLTDQQKLSAALAFGLGSLILLGISETLPGLGVPLSFLLMLSVLVGRPQALQFVSRLAANAQAGVAGGKVAGGQVQQYYGGTVPNVNPSTNPKAAGPPAPTK